MADDLSLRHLYALRDAEPAGTHLGEDEWVGLASGALGHAAREEAVAHVERCATCARVYRGLSELEDGARAFDKDVPAAIGPAPLQVLGTTRWAWWGGLAAAAALVFAIAQPKPALAPVTPSGSDLRGPGDTRPVLAEPLGSVAAWPTRLRWEPVANTRAYRVRVLDGEGNALWASPLVRENEIAWPSSLAPRPGRTYWQVTAYGEGGTETDGVASELASFDYQP